MTIPIPRFAGLKLIILLVIALFIIGPVHVRAQREVPTDMKIFMLPTPLMAVTDLTNSIHQIVLHLQRELPAFGVELTEDRAEADLIVAHAGQTAGFAPCDVAHVHGLYPTALYVETDWHWAANTGVINNVLHARQITVPSEWVADLLRRDMHINPQVIGWAIDPTEWDPAPHQNYVLWNKTRADGVCDPAPMIDLARRANRQLFLTTFGHGTQNIKAVGRQPFEVMKDMVRHAQVYLATTKETYGIGTLEAMASGVPVLGYDWGATAEIVQHGRTGYLVQPGDIDGLLAGLNYCTAHRDILGANGRAAAQHYTWSAVAQRFAQIYRLALEPRQGPKVSVVIPCHNYAQYVGQAIRSVQAQETTFDFELHVVVDFPCSDDSYQVAGDAIYDHKNPHLKPFIQGSEYGGPAQARNAGIEASRAEYIVCLDADDQLGSPRFLQTLADALDQDRTLGIAFTALKMINEDGSKWASSKWPDGYNFEQQLLGANQVPTCCMFRREAWERAGGYRKQYTPAEDAELWLRMGALGYGGRQVTPEPWFLYRWHDNSLSSAVREGRAPTPDWLRDKGWLLTGQRPFASDGRPPRGSWPVRNYDQPAVTVIVPFAAYHLATLAEALDSVERQTETAWELILVNDSGARVDWLLDGYPFVRVVNTPGGCGASYARNRGIEAACAPLVTFLDADDTFDPHFLELMLKEYSRSGRYVYCDWLSLNKQGQIERHDTPEYNPNEVFRRTSIHSINVVIPRQWTVDVGMFDEAMRTWEDVDFFMKLAKAGHCGTRLALPLITYRYSTGQLREAGEGIKPELKALLRERYGDYISGAKMCGCNDAGLTAGEGLAGSGELVRIEYMGPIGTHQVIGMATKRSYGRRSRGDIFLVDQADIDADRESFKLLREIAAVQATPVPPPPEPINA